MRSLLAALLGLAAALVGLFAVPTAWIAHNVSSEDGYVALTEPLVSDAALQDAVAAYVAETLVDRGRLPESLQGPATTALTAAARQAGSAPGFVEAWSQTQALSHRATFGPDGDGSLRIDLAPLAEYLKGHVTGALPVEVGLPDSLPITVGQADPTIVTQVDEAPDRALLGTVATGVLALGALVVARRRSTALVWLGVGALAVAAVLTAVSHLVVPELIDSTAGVTDVGLTLQHLLVERVAGSLSTWTWMVAIGGAVAVAVGLLARLVGARR